MGSTGSVALAEKVAATAWPWMDGCRFRGL